MNRGPVASPFCEVFFVSCTFFLYDGGGRKVQNVGKNTPGIPPVAATVDQHQSPELVKANYLSRRLFVKRSAGTAIAFGIGIQTTYAGWSVSGCVKDEGCSLSSGRYECKCHGGKDCSRALCSSGHPGHENFCRRASSCETRDGFCDFYDNNGNKCCEAQCWLGENTESSEP